MSDWRCERCGSDQWVGYRSSPQAVRLAQCVPCGHVQPTPPAVVSVPSPEPDEREDAERDAAWTAFSVAYLRAGAHGPESLREGLWAALAVRDTERDAEKARAGDAERLAAARSRLAQVNDPTAPNPYTESADSEVELLRHLEQNWIRLYELSQAELAAVQATLTRVRELHVHEDDPMAPATGICTHDQFIWPCATAAVVGEPTPPTKKEN